MSLRKRAFSIRSRIISCRLELVKSCVSYGIVLLLVAFSLRAQTPLSPDLAALTKIRQRMVYNLDHQPNYTCVETIERASRLKANGNLKVVDILRLEVALVDGRELFAWPGAKKFEEADVSKMITSGAIGNGNFGTYAKSLFTTTVPTFHYAGEEDFQGKRAIHFEFKITQMFSGWSIRFTNAGAIVGYHGSFYADPVTFDLEHIDVIADDIPSMLMLSSVQDKVDYAVARIGDGNFLLPSESELSLVGVAGTEDRNHVKFSSCRQFSGESVLTFGDAPASKEEGPAPAREFDLPLGLDLELVLEKDIDLSTAAMGDPVYARLTRDLKDKMQIVVPKGATATGRIVRLEKEADHSVVGIEFPEIEAPGILAHMKGYITRTVGIPRAQNRPPPMSVGRGGSPIGESRSEDTIPNLRTPQHLGEGIISVNPTVRILTHGSILFWRT